MMKSRCKNLEDCGKLFQIEIPKEVIDKAIDETYNEIKKVAKIPGFRPGAAPRDLLEKHHGDAAREEVLKKLIPESYQKALGEHKVIPVSLPRVSNIKFEKGKPLTFDAHVDSKPSFKLKSYKDIKVNKDRISFSKEEIEEALQRISSMYAEYNSVDRAAQKGDYAVSDVEAFWDGKPISRKQNNMWIEVNKDASMLGLGEELVGLKKGDTKEIEKKLPDNYPDKKYAGKQAKFKITVNDIKEKKPAKIDDEFAKNLKFNTVDELKKNIEEEILKKKEENLKINMKNQILEKLLKDNKFTVPGTLVERQKTVFEKRLEAELLKKGINKEEAEKKVLELGAKLLEDAKSKVQLYFILDEIASSEKIEVTKSDIDEKFRALASYYNQPETEVRKYYENENLIGGLEEELKEEKTIDLLLARANVTESKG